MVFRSAMILRLSITTTAAAIAMATPVGAQAQSHALDIPAQDLGTALKAIAAATGQQVVFKGATVRGKRSNAVRGTYSADEAVAVATRGSGLSASRSPRGIIVITQAARPRPAPAESASSSGESTVGIAQAENESAEIIVTAQKREERLQDVPVPVTALRAEALAETGQTRLQDYFARVPGLNFQAGSRGEPLVSIRGINSLQNPTVGVMVDDLPFGATIFRGGGNIAPDIDPSDLQRVEVLRGPQGTLYGVSSLGGLIKYVTVDPSTRGVSGSIQTGITSVEGGDDLGYNLRGSLNLPLSPTLALRASAYTRSTPGYIDNPAANLEDVNRETSAGGRLTLLWRPLDALSVKLSALYQSRDTNGANQVTMSLGGLNQNYLVGSGWIKRDIQSYTATVEADLGGVRLTSLTGYNFNRFNDSVDLSSAYGPTANAQFGVSGAAYIEDYKTKKFNQELRLASSLGKVADLFFGGFYTKETFTNPIGIWAASPSTGKLVGRFQFYDGHGAYEEVALFGDLTVHLGDRFDIQFGGRQSWNRQRYAEVDTGALTAGGRLVIPDTVVKESPFTFLVTPRFRFSDDAMVYARIASGYRAGGINLFFARGFPVPPGYRSDKTYNYEIGFKGDLFDRRLSVDASLFYIDWRDLQLGFNYAPGVNYQANGSRAKSQGIELSLVARPWHGMTLSASGSYNDAVLAEGFGSSTTRGVKGDRLPFSSKFTGTVSAEQRFDIASNWSGFVSGSLAYIGDRIGLFRPTAVRQVYPEYTQIDFSAGVESAGWKATAFITNLGDKRGLVGGGIGQTIPTLFTYIQPRTFGLSLSYGF